MPGMLGMQLAHHIQRSIIHVVSGICIVLANLFKTPSNIAIWIMGQALLGVDL